ncbi:MAG TPA: hypothetical protein PK228_07530, partial [Saprospiraceae bacterium]|nr:hypothetical protein [Saprospiraceae bacterium]
MITTDKLYKLISTLQSAEKRYFKLLVARQEGSSQQYMHLFQLMESSIVRDIHDDPVFTLDEAALIVRMKRKGVPENQFHVIRYQLAQMLFKALRLMQEENNKEDSIKLLLKNAGLLERRGLFDWADEMAEEALDTAQQYEYHALAIEALCRLVYLRSQRDTQRYAEKLKDNLQDIETTAQHLISENRLFSLSYQALALFRTTKGIKQDTMEPEIERLLHHPLLSDPATADTFLSKLYYHHTQATLAYLRKGHREAMPLFARVVELWENDIYRHFQEERPRQFIVHLANYLNFCIIEGDFATYDLHIKSLENFKPSNFDDEAEVFQNKFFLQQLYYLNQGLPEEARKLIPHIEKGLKKYDFKINKSRLFSIRYHIILTFFALGEYEKALGNCETLQKYGKSEQRRDVQLFTNILRNIAHLELENFEALERFILMARNNLNPDIPSPDFERIVLIYLSKLAELYLNNQTAARLWQKVMKPVLEEFQKALEEFAASRPPKIPLGYEETLIWVKSKVSGKPF